MNRMVGLLLLVPLAVILASDGVSSKLECAYEKTKFCYLMTSAHLMNDEVMDLFRYNDSFKEDMEGVLSANEEILEILKEKNRTEVRETLRNVLLLETSALSQLEFSCNGTKKEEYECMIGMDSLFKATYGLVTAAKEIAEETQLDAIKKADRTFQKDSRGKSSKDPELLYALVNETLKALEQEE